MEQTSAYFRAGLYPNSLLCTVGADGRLKIGIKKTATIDKDWTIFDNFTLTYLGEYDTPNDIQAFRPYVSSNDVYTLQGVKLEMANIHSKSIYIVDGKKVMLK
jgi:hypothetical protein